MIPVEDALARLLSLAPTLDCEEVPLHQANGRVLAQSVKAQRDQPPFAASAMDGYAVCDASVGESLTVIAESAAGHGFDGTVLPGQAVRIFTGAPLPKGAQRVIIQEDIARDGDRITLTTREERSNIRPAGGDFRAGDAMQAPRRLGPADIALLAAMNISRLYVTKRPDVALISTGDELVMPGEMPKPDQIVVSNTFGLHALLSDLGAAPRILPIARDTASSLSGTLALAQEADLIITIGGASVGDHDLVADVAQKMGLERAFHKVSMRPGKPLMSGRIGRSMMIGLPGNPVSAMVCGHVFVAPVIRQMLGLPAPPESRLQAPLATPLPANGPRAHYMRARMENGLLHPFEKQDSSLLSILSKANTLLIRPPFDKERTSGESVEYMAI